MTRKGSVEVIMGIVKHMKTPRPLLPVEVEAVQVSKTPRPLPPPFLP